MPRPEILATVTALVERFSDRTFTIHSADQAGIPAHRLRSAIRAGAVVRLRPGVYRLSPAVARRPQEVPVVGRSDMPASEMSIGTSGARGITVAEELRLSDRIDSLIAEGIPACAGERTAARLRGVDLWGVRRERLPVVAVPRGSVRRGPVGGVTIIERDIEERHVLEAPGITPLRAVDPLLSALQVASSQALTPTQRLAIVVSGMREQVALSRRLPSDDYRLAQHLDRPGIRTALLAELEQRIHGEDLRGRGRLLTLIPVVDPRLESVLECISWSRFHEAGIPLPTPQAEIAGASGRRWRVDFLFGDHVIGECDGAVKYVDARSLWREKKRQEDLEQAGYIVVRWTWEEILYHPESVMARIALATSRASALSGIRVTR